MSDETQSPLAGPAPWDLVSEGYEKYTRNFLGKYSEAGREGLGLASSHRLLDVACGPGTTSLLYAPEVERVDAVDFAEDMLAIFRRNLAEHSLGNVHPREADGQALPFDDNTFDRAVSMFGLMFFPDRVQGIKEMVRCLKPGGRALVASWAPVDQSPLMQTMFDAGRKADPDMPPPKRDLLSWENPKLLREELEKGGFVDVEIREQFCTYEFPSGGVLWDEMVEGAVPLVLARKGMGEEVWAKFSATCREHLDEALAGETERGSTAFLAYANKPG